MSKSNPHLVDSDTELVGIIEVRSVKPRKPPLYRVMLLNDDYTPMEFVVLVLRRFFQMNDAAAERLMLQVHTSGQAVCGVFSHEIAESKVSKVNRYARQNKHPLLCTMEPENRPC